MKKLNEAHLARLFLLLATGMWGMSFPLVKAIRGQFYCSSAAAELELSSSFVFLRFTFASLLFGIGLYFFSKKKPVLQSYREIYIGLLLGLSGGLGILLQTDGLAYTDPGTSAFLTQLTCVLVPLVAVFQKKRKINFIFSIALLLGVGGVYLLSGFDFSQMKMGRGEAETLLAALMFTLQILLLESRRFQKHTTLFSTWTMFICFALVNLPFFKLSQLCVNPLEGQSVFLPPALLAIVVFFCSLLTFGLMNLWQAKISATEASFIYSLEAVFALCFNFLWIPLLVFWGYTLSLEKPGLSFSLGALMLIAANFFLFYEALRKPLRI